MLLTKLLQHVYHVLWALRLFFCLRRLMTNPATLLYNCDWFLIHLFKGKKERCHKILQSHYTQAISFCIQTGWSISFLSVPSTLLSKLLNNCSYVTDLFTTSCLGCQFVVSFKMVFMLRESWSPPTPHSPLKKRGETAVELKFWK